MLSAALLSTLCIDQNTRPASHQELKCNHKKASWYTAGVKCGFLGTAGVRAWLEARRAAKAPIEARILQGILDASEVPYR